MNEQTKQSVDQTTSPERPESPKLESRVRNWSRDVAMTLLVVLPIGWAFEHIADRDTLEHLLKFQKHLYESVSNLNPLHLFGYLFDGFGFFQSLAAKVLFFVLPAGFAEFLMRPLSILFFALGFCVLPITVLIEGNFLEVIMVFAIYLPLAGLTVKSLEERGDDGSGTLIGLLVSLGIASLFFWIVQLAMQAGLYAFGQGIQTVQLLVGVPVVGYATYWSLVRGTEHTVTERILHRVFQMAKKAHLQH